MPIGRAARCGASSPIGRAALCGAIALLCCSACESSQPSRAKPAGASVASAHAAVGSASAQPPAPPAPPHRIDPLAADCPRPAVALTTIPGKMSRVPYLPWVEAAFRAHPEFVLVTEAPSKPMEVRILSYPKRQKDDSDEPRFYVLAARCADADTCNKAATMFASAVPESAPTTVCGATIRGTYGPGTGFDLPPFDPEDPRHQRARWVVCKRQADKTYNAGPLCERATPKQVVCAKRETCEQVLACAASPDP